MSHLTNIRKYVAARIVTVGLAWRDGKGHVRVGPIDLEDMVSWCKEAMLSRRIGLTDIPELMDYVKRLDASYPGTHHYPTHDLLAKFMATDAKSIVGKEIRRLMFEHKSYTQDPPEDVPDAIGLQFEFQTYRLYGPTNGKMRHQCIIRQFGIDGDEVAVVYPISDKAKHLTQYPTMCDFVEHIAALKEHSGNDVYVASSKGHECLYGHITDPIVVRAR